MTKEEEKTYMQEHNLIKLGLEYHWCGIQDNEEIKMIRTALEENCRDDQCRIESYFNYIKKMPYEKGEHNKDKNSIDVLIAGKGDCDERSDLLASMMLQRNYKCILIYTNDHTFAGVNIPNYKSDKRKTHIEYNHKKYYYAETTDENATIGGFNRIGKKEIRYAYNTNEKKEIPLNQITFNLN